MKFSFIIITLLLLNSACKKEKTNAAINLRKINEVSNMKTASLATRNVAFSSLTSSEKAFIWSDHIQKLSASMDLDNNQKSIITEALNLLNFDIFNALIKNNFTGQLKLLEYKAKNSFSVYEYLSLFESLYPIVNTFDLPLKPNKLKTSFKTDDETEGGGNCYCKYDLWCQGQTGSELSWCQWSGCIETEDGCGLLGWSSCKGWCTRAPKNPN